MKKITIEIFIEKANEKHNSKYDYSKVEYVNYQTKVCIICPIHGEFWQSPCHHLQGCGCPKCGIKKMSQDKSLTFKNFIEKSKIIHGDKYDYSKVEYVNNHTKVCIICPIHGEFWQTPMVHLRGGNCPKCGIEKSSQSKTLTTEEFIKKAKIIHGDKYDYSKVKYINAYTKVCIICPIHGEFFQLPMIHLKKSGCPKCGIEKTSQKLTFTTEDFIKKAKEIHGDKYDYSKVNYINGKTKVCIICPIHGEFYQKPYIHLNGNGCQKCSIEKSSQSKTFTTEDFIKKAKEIHGDKYDYSKVEYKNNRIKICIICKEHGEFWQTPHSHLKGCGCPKCNQSHLENEIYNFLKENNIEFETQKRFKWLGYQSLDFYLPKYNIVIECQGLQHFKPIEYFGGEECFKMLIKRDKQKQQVCKKHNIKLLYYSKLDIKYPYEVIEDKELLLKEIKKS